MAVCATEKTLQSIHTDGSRRCRLRACSIFFVMAAGLMFHADSTFEAAYGGKTFDRDWVAFIAFAWPRWGRGSCVQICGGLVAVVMARYCGSPPRLHVLPVGKIARG